MVEVPSRRRIRITSYNVCYTKLCEPSPWEPHWGSLSRWRPGAPPPAGPAEERLWIPLREGRVEAWLLRGEDLLPQVPRFVAFARRGGHLVVLYHKDQEFNAAETGVLV